MATDIYKTIADVLNDSTQNFCNENNLQNNVFSADVLPSDRPDLSDFQTNIAMQIAKKLQRPSHEIAEQLAEKMRDNPTLAGIEIRVDQPGFINFKLSDELIIERVSALKDSDITEGNSPDSANPKTILIDYGGANLGKEPHLGHVRSAVIGQALYNLGKKLGYTMIGDNHVGDWGQPMGMIIAGLERRFPDWACFQPTFTAQDSFELPIGEDNEKGKLSLKELNAVYPAASQRMKFDADFRKQVKETTAQLQSGQHPGYTRLWQSFRTLSLEQNDAMFSKLGVSFDRVDGESTYHSEIGDMLEDLSMRGLIERNEDDELVMNVAEEGDDHAVRPLKLQTADGAYTYGASDLAAIRKRVREDNPAEIWYVVDRRQEPHFEQVFRAAGKAGYRGTAKLEFLPFGTRNDRHGKPVKTRDGGVMSLRRMLDIATDEVKRNSTITQDEAALTHAASAIIFDDLINHRRSDVAFPPEQLVDFGGKSAAFVQYAFGNMDSLLQKPEANGTGNQAQLSEHTRKLGTLLMQYEHILHRAFELRAPHICAKYLYDVSRAFGKVFREVDADAETIDPFIATLSRKARNVMQESASILGISLVGDMKRKTQDHRRSEAAISGIFADGLQDRPVLPIEKTPLAEGAFDAFKAKCERLAELLEAKTPELINALSVYEPAETAKDEIILACKCLRDLEPYKENFTHKIPKVSALLHANLPIYYYVVLAAIPSLMANEVHLRPNQHMQDKKVIARLKEVQLDPDDPSKNLFNYFDNIITHEEMGRDQFFESHFRDCDYGIVNGAYEDGYNILHRYMKPGATLVSEGKHHDPFVVTSTADIAEAVKHAVFLKAYNGGQECAAPDAILVHASVANDFIRQFTEAYLNLKIGASYEDPEVRIGPPAAGEADLKRAANFLKKFREDHPHVKIEGGEIDWEKGIIHPAIVVTDLKDMSVSPNYEELFNPIQFIHVYRTPGELRRYFESEHYPVSKGYVSVFCNDNPKTKDRDRDWLLERNDDRYTGSNSSSEEDTRERDQYGIGRVIVNGSIHNLLNDSPLAPFGGYSTASFVLKRAVKDREAMWVDSFFMPVSHAGVIKDFIVDEKAHPTSILGIKLEPRRNKIPDLKAISENHALLGPNHIEVAYAYSDGHLRGVYDARGDLTPTLTPAPISVAIILDQPGFPSSAQREEAKNKVEKALADSNHTLGRVTFVTSDYVRKELEKCPNFFETPEPLIKVVLAFANSVSKGRCDGDQLAADKLRGLGEAALKRWSRNILMALPCQASQQNRTLAVLAHKQPWEVVTIALNTIINQETSLLPENSQEALPTEKKSIPEITLGNGDYYINGLKQNDYNDLLAIAKTPDFLFAPLNGRKDTRMAGKMAVEDNGNEPGSVSRYMQEGLSPNNYVFLIKSRNGEVVGGIDLVDLTHKGETNEAEIGIFIAPSHQHKVPIRSSLSAVLDWAHNDLGINSLRVMVDPDNKITSKMLMALNKRNLNINVGIISEDETSFTNLEGQPAGRRAYRIPPYEFSKMLNKLKTSSLGSLDESLGAFLPHSIEASQNMRL